ncbi:DUF2577 domain-containing protein [Paenibacillus antarcticus]|uniref:DUF2577 domain-containing protein n=1 Tax=Paenibacillus antarcticus TaxID=253703 RepID=A0A168P9P2_9BACL|nr:DUF2577 domain-containing protein [Paenibacillus antarcticus]OAB46537.1 hypothetical protein PBAT_10995 [Paenibacillus antarcticus]
MLDVIKQAALEVIKNSNPTAVMFGTVLSISPLEISVDQRLILTEAFLIVPESMGRFEIDLKHVHAVIGLPDTKESLLDKIVIRKGLESGDKVILMRLQGGQQFVVMDKVVSG